MGRFGSKKPFAKPRADSLHEAPRGLAAATSELSIGLLQMFLCDRMPYVLVSDHRVTAVIYWSTFQASSQACSLIGGLGFSGYNLKGFLYVKYKVMVANFL